MNMVEELCVVLGVHYDDVTGPCRKRELIRYRKAISIALSCTGMTYSQIGHMMHRNHATVLYHVNVIEPDETEKEYIRIMRDYIDSNWNRDPECEEQNIRFPLFPQPGPR